MPSIVKSAMCDGALVCVVFAQGRPLGARKRPMDAGWTQHGNEQVAQPRAALLQGEVPPPTARGPADVNAGGRRPPGLIDGRARPVAPVEDLEEEGAAAQRCTLHTPIRRSQEGLQASSRAATRRVGCGSHCEAGAVTTAAAAGV